MAMTPQLSKDAKRLRKMTEKMDRDEAYFQARHGDPEPGSVRESRIFDAEALRRVLAYISAEAKQ